MGILSNFFPDSLAGGSSGSFEASNISFDGSKSHTSFDGTPPGPPAGGPLSVASKSNTYSSFGGIIPDPPARSADELTSLFPDAIKPAVQKRLQVT